MTKFGFTQESSTLWVNRFLTKATPYPGVSDEDVLSTLLHPLLVNHWELSLVWGLFDILCHSLSLRGFKFMYCAYEVEKFCFLFVSLFYVCTKNVELINDLPKDTNNVGLNTYPLGVKMSQWSMLVPNFV